MWKKVFTTLLLVLFAASAAAPSLTVEILDSSGSRVDADLELIKDQNDNTVAGPTDFISTTINSNQNYTLIKNISSAPNVTIYDFTIDQDFDLKPRIYTDQNPSQNFLTNTDTLYYNNQSLNFTKAEYKIERNEPDSIAECTSISAAECTSWTVRNTTQYSSSYTGSIFKYNVSSFSGHTSGEEAPLPEIQDLEIYNVSGVQNRRTDGSLVDEGLNKTFQISQQDSTEYRFEFNVTNNGSEKWNLGSGDELSHNGLNQSWSVNETDDIYYRVNGSVKEGGTFSNGDVNWNTSNGGQVGVDDNLSAEYIVNISQDSTNTFNQNFNASTSSGTSDQDYHNLRTLILGQLSASIDRPQNDSVIQNNRAFKLNGTVNCLNGECGDITGTPRQNQSTGQEDFTGNEFEVLNSNNTCGNLLEGQSCTLNWSVNATGDPNTFHELDFSASSNYSKIGDDNTTDRLVEIRDILIISLDWNVTDFGILDPGEKENSAEKNSEGYNVTVEQDSNKVDNLWLKATPLVSKELSSYQIGPGNMSWWDEKNYADSKNFSTSYSLVDNNLPPGTTKTLYYWLDVPFGITLGKYNGTMTFKVNQTQ